MADRGSVLSGPRGPAVAVVGADTRAGAELAAGLDELGAAVGRLDVAALDGRAEFAAALDASAERLGGLDGVVVASVGTPPTLSGAVAELEPDAWTARVEIPLHRTLVCFHGALGALRAVGGSMVLLVPTLSLVGAAGYGPWAAVTEGQRALAKAAARAWGSHAITVNCVAVPGALLTPANDGDRGGFGLHRPGQPPPAFGRPQMRVEVSGVVHSLLSPAWRPVTGATVAVDGGVWMTP
ncbi:MAG TPA: SDR family oxidoreductase [Acidimicrobiales bacterium]|nr:SDR family oxidoreductase [Acidimicrobiales bacterium]